MHGYMCFVHMICAYSFQNKFTFIFSLFLGEEIPSSFLGPNTLTTVFFDPIQY